MGTDSIGILRDMVVYQMVRFQSNQFGTFSLLTLQSGKTLIIGELPWKDNRPNLSCIPKNEYVCRRIISPKFGEVYKVDNVPNRTNILIHAANFVGDTEKRLKSDVLGCLAPGKRMGTLSLANKTGQLAVLASGDALRELLAEVDGESFLLNITGVVG